MFKPILENEDEITDYIVEFASDFVDPIIIKEYFFECNAILRTEFVDHLKEGDKNHNIKNPNKEKHYKKLPIITMPPLIVRNYEVLDGNHRLRVAKKLGVKEVLIYDILQR